MQYCCGLLEGAWNRKYSKVSLELGGGQRSKNAKGVQGWSWKNSEMLLEQKTGCPLTAGTVGVMSIWTFLGESIFFD